MEVRQDSRICLKSTLNLNQTVVKPIWFIWKFDAFIIILDKFNNIVVDFSSSFFCDNKNSDLSLIKCRHYIDVIMTTMAS